MARLLNDAGDADSGIFRIDKKDIPAKLQIHSGGGTETAEIHVAGDGTNTTTAAATMEQYVVDNVDQLLDEKKKNALALDTVGIYQIKNKTVGTSKIHLATPGNL